MNYSTAIFLFNKNARAVKCEYEPSDQKTKIFKTLDPSIKKDDMVVVATSTRHGFTVVKVVETDIEFDIDTSEQVAWVVAKVDKGAYDVLLAKEAETIRMIRSAEIRKKRDEMASAIFKDQEELRRLPLYQNGEKESGVDVAPVPLD